MHCKAKWIKTFKYVWIIYSVFSIVFVLFLIDRLLCKDTMDVSNRYILDGGWNISVNDQHYANVDLDNFLVDSTVKNDIIVLEKVIPSDYEYKQAVLAVFSRHSAMSLYVDNELKYEYGHDRHKQNKSTGCGYQFIDFFEDYKGKTLRIEYIVSENKAFSKFDIPWISEWRNLYRYIITENRLPLWVGSFLMVLGVIMICILIFSVAISTKYSNVLLLAIFSLCIGIWTLCYYNIMFLFSIPVYSISLMQYMSLFIAPLPMILYVRAYVKEINSKVVSLIYNILFVVQLILSVAAIMMHSLDIVHAAEMLKYFHLMFVVLIMFFIYLISYHMRKSTTLSKISTVGMLIVALCICYELLKYIVPRYLGCNLIEVKGIASIGVVVLIGILVIDLYLEVTRNMMEEHEKMLLIKRAYTDELTQIHNRAYCTDYMHEVSKEENKGYTIINFDLNGLKKMNDTYGHAKGDELICAAARVIDKSFSADGVVGRMGGDEFIAIIDTADVKRIEQLVKKFKSNIQETNKENPNLGLSISYGYATNEEMKGAEVEKLYQLADERMYVYKQNVKKMMQS